LVLPAGNVILGTLNGLGVLPAALCAVSVIPTALFSSRPVMFTILAVPLRIIVFNIGATPLQPFTVVVVSTV